MSYFICRIKNSVFFIFYYYQPVNGCSVALCVCLVGHLTSRKLLDSRVQRKKLNGACLDHFSSSHWGNGPLSECSDLTLFPCSAAPRWHVTLYLRYTSSRLPGPLTCHPLTAARSSLPSVTSPPPDLLARHFVFCAVVTEALRHAWSPHFLPLSCVFGVTESHAALSRTFTRYMGFYFMSFYKLVLVSLLKMGKNALWVYSHVYNWPDSVLYGLWVFTQALASVPFYHLLRWRTKWAKASR